MATPSEIKPATPAEGLDGGRCAVDAGFGFCPDSIERSETTQPIRVGSVAGSAPLFLFHVTTGRKAKLYRQTGQINAPVRGFDSLQGAMAWAMKVGRKVIMRVEPVNTPHMLPDHHNNYGRAWWTEAVPMTRVKCAYSAEGAWALPNTPRLGVSGCRKRNNSK